MNTEDVVLSIDEDSCVKCGLCVSTYPDVFEFQDDNSIKVKKNVEEDLSSEIIGMCSVGAIMKS